jgi:toxin ParE1/3/4
MAVVDKHARARRDLVEHYVYLAENGSTEIADRFLARAEESFRDVACYPEMGLALSLRSPRLAGMRKWRVSDFEQFLILLSTACQRSLDCAGSACRAGLVGASGNRLRARSTPLGPSSIDKRRLSSQTGCGDSGLPPPRLKRLWDGDPSRVSATLRESVFDVDLTDYH